LKAVITCAGKGTRMLPFSKELPKEMAPIFTLNNNEVEVKPLIQHIFENLFKDGVNDFCFVTGKTKRSIEDHFSPNLSDDGISSKLDEFYNMLKKSRVMWVNQLEPKGFGDAVSVCRPYVNEDNFILHAGDVTILPKNASPISKLASFSDKSDVEAVILLKTVEEPERHGIATVKSNSDRITEVVKVVEKPDHPESKLGIMPIYFFRSSIFTALEKTTPGKNNEIQLTDAIQNLINMNKKVLALRVDDQIILDVGTPESFWQALNQSYNLLPYSKKLV
jgi:UTP--glucose-1-phosphate uridylyltransferase